MALPFDGESWTTTTATVDLSPFWKRHLKAQLRLYAAAAEREDAAGKTYRSAVIWGLTTFLQALGNCSSEASLRVRAADAGWWDALCRAELASPSLLDLRIGEVPISGHSLAKAALALRYLELTRRLTVDPTRVLDNPPAPVLAWLREEP
ncbi:MAG: hypothetical protein ACRDHP_17570 [Ktedonobacterales bacterium]